MRIQILTVSEFCGPSGLLRREAGQQFVGLGEEFVVDVVVERRVSEQADVKRLCDEAEDLGVSVVEVERATRRRSPNCAKNNSLCDATHLRVRSLRNADGIHLEEHRDVAAARSLRRGVAPEARRPRRQRRRPPSR